MGFLGQIPVPWDACFSSLVRGVSAPLIILRTITTAQGSQRTSRKKPEQDQAIGRNKEPFTEMGKLWAENICGGGNQEFAGTEV